MPREHSVGQSPDNLRGRQETGEGRKSQTRLAAEFQNLDRRRMLSLEFRPSVLDEMALVGLVKMGLDLKLEYLREIGLRARAEVLKDPPIYDVKLEPRQVQTSEEARRVAAEIETT